MILTPQDSETTEEEKENIAQERVVVDAYKEALPSAHSRVDAHMNLEQLWKHVQSLCKASLIASR